MKKSLLKVVVATGVLSSLAVSNANVNFTDLKFYAGVGGDYNTYSITPTPITNATISNLKKNGIGFSIPILGVRFHENFGVEASYTFNKNATYSSTVTNTTTNHKIKIRNIYFDVIGTVPVAEQFDVLGGLGIGRLSTKLDTASANNKFTWRAKIGAQYNIMNNIIVRGIISYQKGKAAKLDGLKSLTNIGLYGIYVF